MTRLIKTINFIMMTTMIITIITMKIIQISTITATQLKRKMSIKVLAAARRVTSRITRQTIRAHLS